MRYWRSTNGAGAADFVPQRPAARRLLETPQLALVLVILLTGALLSVLKANFLTEANLAVITAAITTTGIVALAQMTVLGAGAMDLSLGGIGAISAVLCGMLMSNLGFPTALAIAGGLLVGMVAGACNACLVLATNVSPFLLTLATGSVFSGIALGLTDSNPITNLPHLFDRIGSASWGPLSVPFVLMLALMATMYCVFQFTGLGHQILAFGSSARAAEVAGVSRRRVNLAVFSIAGGLAACAGILFAATLGEADPTIGGTWLLNSFAAPVIGGTALIGGSVSAIGAVLGSLLLELIQDILVYLNVNIYWLDLFSGAAVIAAVAVDRMTSGEWRIAGRMVLTEWPSSSGEIAANEERLQTGTAPLVLGNDKSPPSLGEAAVLEALGVSKRFGGVHALDGASCTVRAGEVHALVGENGAGKSTLIKIISGVHRADGGQIRVGGLPVHVTTPREAMRLGISVVHQERSLVGAFTVGENVMLPEIVSRGWQIIRRRALYAEATRYLQEVGMTASPGTPVRQLSPGQRQLVEIARALSAGARLIVFDEPTASLSLTEVQRLAEVIRKLRAQGVGVLYVTHKLEEVYALCDTVTVLRDGKNVGDERRVDELPRDTLVEMMVGRVVSSGSQVRKEAADGEVVMVVRNLWSNRTREAGSFELRGGEILAWYGLVGSGRTELARAIVAADRPRGGDVVVNGRRMHPKSVGEALKKWRVAYVTENRQEEGLFLTHSLARNVAATTWSHLRGRFGLLSGAGEARLAERYRGELGIRSSGVSVAVSSLSGGNQQKVSIAKWLAADPEVLIFDEPTVGIDIRTKYELHDVIRKRAEQGRGTIVISSDLAEVVQLADRVLLFRSGDIVGSMLNTHAYDEMSAEIMQAILGGAAESAFTAGSDGLRAGRAKAGEGQE